MATMNTPEHAREPDSVSRVSQTSSTTVRERLLATLPVSERRLRLAGVSTAVLEAGEGPPVVLLHGPGEYGAKWLRVIPDLAKTCRIVAPDLPAHGASEPIAGPPTDERLAAWLDDLIEGTCATPPALVGQILGGAIAAKFACERADRIERLVLADSLGLAPFEPDPAFGRALMAFNSQPGDSTHDELWRLCAYDLDGLRRGLGDRWDLIKAYNLDRARAPELKAAQYAMMELHGFPPIPAEDLARIAVPTFLIWGRHDLATSLSVAEAASAQYGWPLHVIEEAADDPPLERPEEFSEVLQSILRSPRDAAASR